MNSISKAPLKRTSLNPNAKEFVPTSLRSAAAFEQEAGLSTFSDRCEKLHDTSLLDEESRRYWDSHLPDDILTPDLVDSRFDKRYENNQESALDDITKELECTSSYLVAQNITTLDAYPNALWNGNHALPSNRSPSSGNNWRTPLLRSENGFDYLTDEYVEKRLASNKHGDLGPDANLIHDYPALATQSRVDVNQAPGGDLNILGKLQLQENESIWRNTEFQLSSSPNSNFPALSSPDQLINRLSPFLDEVEGQEPAELTTSLRNSTFQRRNCIAEFSLVPPRFSSQHPSSNAERLDHLIQRRNHRAASQSWLENGDTADVRESQNYTRARNPYFEQARPYLKGRAKEATAKGHMYNGLTKAAHTRGGEFFAQQRSMPTPHFSTFSPGQPRLLDLHGLHNNMNEAVTLLRQELCATRAVARSSRQRQQVLIFVGSDWQRSSRGFPAFILGIERYLAESEHLSFTEPQPGLIKVVV